MNHIQTRKRKTCEEKSKVIQQSSLTIQTFIKAIPVSLRKKNACQRAVRSSTSLICPQIKGTDDPDWFLNTFFFFLIWCINIILPDRIQAYLPLFIFYLQVQSSLLLFLMTSPTSFFFHLLQRCFFSIPLARCLPRTGQESPPEQQNAGCTL